MGKPVRDGVAEVEKCASPGVGLPIVSHDCGASGWNLLAAIRPAT
jgi:hypothetical protein